MGSTKRKKRREDIESKRDLNTSIPTFQRLPARKIIRPKGPLATRASRPLRRTHPWLRALLHLREEDPQLQLHPLRGPHNPPLLCGGAEGRVPPQEQGPQRGRRHGSVLHHVRHQPLQAHTQPAGIVRLRSVTPHRSPNQGFGLQICNLQKGFPHCFCQSYDQNEQP